MFWDRNKIVLNLKLSEETINVLDWFFNNFYYTRLACELKSWLNNGDNNKKKFVIDSHQICNQEDYESLLYLRDTFPNTEFGKLINSWAEYTAYDFAAWYIGYDV